MLEELEAKIAEFSGRKLVESSEVVDYLLDLYANIKSLEESNLTGV